MAAIIPLEKAARRPAPSRRDAGGEARSATILLFTGVRKEPIRPEDGKSGTQG